MVYCFMGASCTGKTTIAQELASTKAAKVYNGKDYLRLAKNPSEAETLFRTLLKEAEQTSEVVIFVTAETDLLSLLPTNAKKVLFQAPMETIKERFAKRMNSVLPAPVAAMVERKVAEWNTQTYDLVVNTGEQSTADICNAIVAL